MLITGASGFVGRALVKNFAQRPGVFVRSAVRRSHDSSPLINPVIVGNLGRETDWTSAVEGVNCVVHTAAQVNPGTRRKTTPHSEYHRVNVEGTIKLAEQAAAAGVRRFIFISTAKVLGERSATRQPLSEVAPYAPCDGYASSKMEAELALLALAKHTSMEVVIVRPPMVYGLNAAGNFSALTKLLDRGIPLPIAGIKNLRSFLSIDNLVDFIWKCTWHPAAANQIFHVCDGKDLATPDLVRAIERSLKRPVYLFHCPEPVLRWGFKLLGRMDIHQRLYDSFQLDAVKAKNAMQWSPVVSLEEALLQVTQEHKN